MERSKNKKNVLIGYSGFIGSILKKRFKESNLYNSKNISKIKKKEFNQVICAGIPAQKWLANKYPNKDLRNIKSLINNLKTIKCKLFILISTIDVHKNDDYGRNRKFFEDFVKKNFPIFLIFRLPAVFGKGFKKNILYDLLNDNQIYKINPEDKLQWFDVELLYNEIKKIKKYNKIIELYSPSISNKKIIKEFTTIKTKKLNRKKIIYNYKPSTGYFKNEKFILSRIKLFIKNYEK